MSRSRRGGSFEWLALVAAVVLGVLVVVGLTEVASEVGQGQTTVRLAACSVLKDRVIAIGTSQTSPVEVWVLQESDGKVLSHHTYTEGAPWVVVASSDGEYIAEIVEGGNSTQIRRISDWSVVATLANAQVLRFSGDDSRVFVAPIDSQGHTTAVADVDWRTGRAVWTVDKTVFVPDVAVIPEPGSPAFAVAVMAPGNTAAPFTYIVTIVGDDGTAVDLGNYQIAF